MVVHHLRHLIQVEATPHCGSFPNVFLNSPQALRSAVPPSRSARSFRQIALQRVTDVRRHSSRREALQTG